MAVRAEVDAQVARVDDHVPRVQDLSFVRPGRREKPASEVEPPPAADEAQALAVSTEQEEVVKVVEIEEPLAGSPRVIGMSPVDPERPAAGPTTSPTGAA